MGCLSVRQHLGSRQPVLALTLDLNVHADRHDEKAAETYNTKKFLRPLFLFRDLENKTAFFRSFWATFPLIYGPFPFTFLDSDSLNFRLAIYRRLSSSSICWTIQWPSVHVSAALSALYFEQAPCSLGSLYFSFFILHFSDFFFLFIVQRFEQQHQIPPYRLKGHGGLYPLCDMREECTSNHSKQIFFVFFEGPRMKG